MLTITGSEETIRLEVSSKRLIKLLDEYEKETKHIDWDGFIHWYINTFNCKLNSSNIWEI